MVNIDNNKMWESILGYKPSKEETEEIRRVLERRNLYSVPWLMMKMISSALREQNLEYKDGKIVPIKPSNDSFKIEKDKWYICICDENINYFTKGKVYQAYSDYGIIDDEGSWHPWDANLVEKYFRPASEDEIPCKAKFKVGDIIKKKGENYAEWKITDIDEYTYYGHYSGGFPTELEINEQDDFELIARTGSKAIPYEKLDKMLDNALSNTTKDDWNKILDESSEDTTKFVEVLAKIYSKFAVMHDTFSESDLRSFAEEDAKELFPIVKKQLREEFDEELEVLYKNQDEVVYRRGVADGREEVLNNMPKWKRTGYGYDKPWISAKNELYNGDYVINISELDKLEKEDEED